MHAVMSYSRGNQLCRMQGSVCLCPKEAPVSVFKQDVSTHLPVLKEQACIFVPVSPGRTSRCRTKTHYHLLWIAMEASSASHGHLSPGTNISRAALVVSADGHLNRVHIVQLIFNSSWVAELKPARLKLRDLCVYCSHTLGLQ